MKQVLVLGCRGAGKTTFLAGLAEYCRPSRHNDMVLRPLDETTTAYLAKVQGQLAAGDWPTGTSAVTRLALNLQRGEKASADEVILSAYDYPGELLEDLLRGEPREAYQAAWKEIQKDFLAADTVILLLSVDKDLPKPQADGKSVLSDRQDAAVALLMRAVTNAAEQGPQANSASTAGHKGTRKLPEVFPVVTKVDLLSGFAENEECLSEGVLSQLETGVAALRVSLEHQGFVVQQISPITSVGRTRVEHVAEDGSERLVPVSPLCPLGYERLLGRLFQVEADRKLAGLITPVFAGLAVILTLLLCWWGASKWSHSQAVTNARTVPIDELVSPLAPVLGDDTDEAEVVRERLRAELQNIEKELDSGAPTSERMEIALARLSDIRRAPLNPEVGYTDELIDRITRMLEQRYVSAVEGAVSYLKAKDAGRAYRERFPEGELSEQVSAIMVRWTATEKERMRRMITTLAWDRESDLTERLDRSATFAQLFPDDDRTPELLIANRVAGILLALTEMRIEVDRILLDEDGDGDSGDRISVLFHKSGSIQSEPSTMSVVRPWARDSNWEAGADGAFIDIDPWECHKHGIFITIDDNGEGLTNGEDQFGEILLDPLSEFVRTGAAFPLLDPGTLDLDGDGANLRFAKRLLASYWKEAGAIVSLNSVPFGVATGLDAVSDAVSDAVQGDTLDDKHAGSVWLVFSRKTDSGWEPFLPAECSAFNRFYSTGLGWYPEQ